jgi:hypothetical protein
LKLLKKIKLRFCNGLDTPITFQKGCPITLNQAGDSFGTSYILLSTFTNKTLNNIINVLFISLSSRSKLIIKHRSNNDKLLAVFSCAIGFLSTITTLFTYLIFKGLMK